MSSEWLSSNSSNCLLTIFRETEVPQWETDLNVGVLSLFIVLTIVGNIWTMLCVFTYKPLQKVENYFIVSLAIADLSVAVLVLPFNLLYAVSGRWTFGIGVCKLWLILDIVCCTASILNLCGVALDRFWAITDAVNYIHKRTLKRVLKMNAIIWTLSIIISAPLIEWNDWNSTDELNDQQLCVLTSSLSYVIFSSLGSFFIPLVIMLIVYIEIFRAIRNRLRERAAARQRIIPIPRERRYARILSITIGVFVVCWVPFFLMYVIVPFCATCCPSRRLFNFISWLGYINSFLNPIIYTIFNKTFREAFRELLGLGSHQ